MRSAFLRWVLVFACGLVGSAAVAEPDTALTLKGPDRIDGLLLEDVTGDGVRDVVLSQGRTLWVFASRKNRLPAAEATHSFALPADASLIDAAGEATSLGPGLLVLGPQGLRHIATTSGKASPVGAAGQHLSWQDSRQAAFVDFVREDGSVLIPTEDGWRVLEKTASGVVVRELDAPPDRHLEPSGTFLEDTARMVVAHAHLVRGGSLQGAENDAPRPWWTLCGPHVLLFHGDEKIAMPVPRRNQAGLRNLVDLDADGTPDLCQRHTTNRTGSYAFYRTRAPLIEDGRLRARDFVAPQPTTRLELDGFQLEPRHVDLDGDGLLDFVVTTIPVDARNTVRALTGMVTAYTHAFLQRESGKLYALSPDKSITSDIGIAVRLSKKGTIDVRRSFTILVNADLDGDRRKDLVIRTGEAELTVHKGSPKGVWEEKGETLPIPPLAGSPNVEGFRADLVGDGRDEIVLLYRGGPDGKDLLRIVRPR